MFLDTTKPYTTPVLARTLLRRYFFLAVTYRSNHPRWQCWALFDQLLFSSRGNVGSLRFLINLAIPRRIPVQFLSSNRVTLLSGEYALPPMLVGQYLPPADGSEGFTASKWAGERLLDKVAK